MEYEFGTCTLNPSRRELVRDGQPVHVEPQVFDLLLFLVGNRGRVVSRDDILEAVWNGRIVSDSTLTNRINSARTAIGDSGARQALIRAVARKGSHFIGQVTERGTDTDPFPAPAVSPFVNRPAIAVLPFDNFSADPEQEFFADGITEDLITALAAWRSFPVIARNSTLTFRERPKNAVDVGAELGAAYVVEGSIRRPSPSHQNHNHSTE